MKSKELKKSAPGVFARRVTIKGVSGFAYFNHEGKPCNLEGVTDEEKELQEEAEKE